ncbi:hypothetical protein Dsin_025037 [Dipteronia sinensis]|uniref:Reverse transcriptase zinc-binding domain-containing protein n=1 Tax=Dipteronia sinensis TaxID=43782 RepID=A0AAE0DWK6_9ROSI|nr:hypothetical protein Dsin_025037 [Dipteronia sinensis]
MGDFNAVLGAHESLSLRSPARSSCEDFRSIIEYCDLIGVRSQDIENNSPRPFRFQSMWLDHPDFMALVRHIWSSSFLGKPHQVVINKLKRLKNALKTWNWEVFRDLNSNITGKSAELQSIQFQMSNLDFSDELFLAEPRVHHELNVLLRRHECFYCDRSMVKWLKDGDRNPHSFMPLSDVETEFSVVEDVIPSLVTDVENAFLISIASTGDIHDAVFAMDTTSAPGLDSFFKGFYQHCWEVVGSDVVLAVQDFFRIEFGFMRDRHIDDCISLASDCVNVMHKKCYGDNFSMKIDIRKAFDTLDCIAEDFLTRLLLRMVDFSQLLPISSMRGFSAPTHLLYVDDVLIFCRGTVQNLKNIMSAFEVYGNISGVPILELLGIPDYMANLLRARVSDFIYEEDRLCRAGFHLASRCSVCGVSNESSDHLFLWCPIAAALWEAGFFSFSAGYSADLWSSFFSHAISVSFSDQVRVLWKTAIHAVVWSVWLARNQWIFESKAMKFRSTLSLVWHAVSDANRLEIGCMRNCVDDLLILRRFDLRGRSARAPVIKSVICSPPAPGWIKINTDGAALSSSGVGCCGGVFRNCRSFVKGCFAVPLGQVFAFGAKLLAASMAINLAW